MRGSVEPSDHPRAVVFDFDGVILESADIKTQAFLELFGDYPQHRDAIRRHHLDNAGISRYRKFEWIHRELLGRVLEEEESRRLGEAFSEIALHKILECPFVTGARECLESLADLPTFVASGTPEDELRRIVQDRGLSRYFQGVWGSPDSKVTIVERIMRDYDLEPGEIVFVGDGMSDYEAARSTGVRFVARTTPDLDQTWRELGVRRIADLTRLVELMAAEARG